MSLEDRIAELTASNEVLAAALATNTSILERVVAGQQAAMEKLGEKAPATRTRKAKDEAPAPAAAAPETPPATAETTVTETTDDQVRGAASAFLDGKDPHPFREGEDRKSRGMFLKSIADHFGSPTLAGEKATLDAQSRQQAVFFINRKAAGLDVNFSQDYDFDGDPTQGAAAAPAAEEFDIG